ncbi:DUF4160 domain-containing protein [Sphingobium sp. Leaf26]|uniref:DUF4160 domain-containing protein n=1 Tax=Sphingobium sp. Leaf26 TaxID=1735693 RepID=UPI0022857F73|nr:DUF4160 domain-containing protein [Sphingobium sp. Leaf26]
MDGCRFHVFANEGSPCEPVHIHVAQPDADTKFWLYTEVELAYNRGFDARRIRRFRDIVEARRNEIEDAWNDFFA